MLLLFDIDGTLTRGGPAVTAFRIALEHTYGTAGPVGDYDFAGKTDPRILRDLLGAAGLAPDEIAAGLPRFWVRYLAGLEARIGYRSRNRAARRPHSDRRAGRADDVFLGLVTGNVKRAAPGSSSAPRASGTTFRSAASARITRCATSCRRSRWTGRRGTGAARSMERESVIIGDTPRDMECARAVGAATVAVTTGRFSSAELREAGADRILPDLSDTAAAVEALTAPKTLNNNV